MTTVTVVTVVTTVTGDSSDYCDSGDSSDYCDSGDSSDCGNSGDSSDSSNILMYIAYYVIVKSLFRDPYMRKQPQLGLCIITLSTFRSCTH